MVPRLEQRCRGKHLRMLDDGHCRRGLESGFGGDGWLTIGTSLDKHDGACARNLITRGSIGSRAGATMFRREGSAGDGCARWDRGHRWRAGEVERASAIRVDRRGHGAFAGNGRVERHGRQTSCQWRRRIFVLGITPAKASRQTNTLSKKLAISMAPFALIIWLWYFEGRPDRHS